MMHTHSQHLERWLGVEAVESLSNAMLDWYGPPIALQGVPGLVYACKGGDFIGRIKAGSEVSALERADILLRRSERARRILRGIQRRQSGGFADLTALQQAARTGKRLDFKFVRTTGFGTTTNSSIDLWQVGSIPPAASPGAAAPGGTVHTAADTPFHLPDVSPDTRHFIGAELKADVSANNLLIYDRLFSVAKTMNDMATEAVTGVPTRYTSQTATDADYIGGNFLFASVDDGGTLAATAHNWTVCTYTDQDGNASTVPSFAGRSAAAEGSIDHSTFRWFAALAAGDVGVKALTQMQCDAAVTGALCFVIGHPIAFMPCPLANILCQIDGINTAFNFVRVFDGACLAFLEINKPNSSATVYRGQFTLVHG